MGRVARWLIGYKVPCWFEPLRPVNGAFRRMAGLTRMFCRRGGLIGFFGWVPPPEVEAAKSPGMAGDRKLPLNTGAAGFVGSRIAHRFVREGMSVRALDRRPIDVAGVGGRFWGG